MGNQPSSRAKQPSRDTILSLTSKAIDKRIKMDEAKNKRELKLLLLGAQESGKSTLLKQMRLLYGSISFTERQQYRDAIFETIYRGIQQLLGAAGPLSLRDHQIHAALFQDPFEDLVASDYFNPVFLLPLKQLWSDKAVQKAYTSGLGLGYNDNLAHFFNQLDTIWSVDYVPTDKDVLRCKEQTHGMTAFTFRIGPYKYQLVDAGNSIMAADGKKWLHVFDNISAVLFTVNVGGYDQGTLDDPNSNQIRDALIVFHNICNSPWLKDTTIFILLNKMDVFRQKLKTSRVSKYFGDYQGDNDNEEQVLTYFKRRFQSLNMNPKRHIFVDYTNALDGQLFRQVSMTIFNVITSNNQCFPD
ncbi:putative guanine nucleotide-binding protein alpha-2 subunit [Gongronella butleri]|nr:putative guanine nucleotide-binding protein alpha-2 subunit [Gongronella butleri]